MTVKVGMRIKSQAGRYGEITEIYKEGVMVNYDGGFLTYDEFTLLPDAPKDAPELADQ